MAERTICDICGGPCRAGSIRACEFGVALIYAFWTKVDICEVCVIHIKRLTKTGLCRIDPCPVCGCEREEVKRG